MVLVTFQQGEIGAAHRHPVPTFAYVIQGKFESTFDGKVYHYKTGDTFYEKPGKLHGEKLGELLSLSAESSAA